MSTCCSKFHSELLTNFARRGLTREQTIDAVSQAWVDGQSLRTYRHAPNTGSRKSWAAGDACSRAVNLAYLVKRGEIGLPSVLTAKTWGFYDVLFKACPSSHFSSHIRLFSANRANHSSSSARMARTLWRMYSSRSRTRLSSTHRLLSRLHTPYMRSSRHWASPLMTLRQCISEPRRLPCVSSTRRVNFITSRTESKRSNPSPFRKTNLLIAFAIKPRHQLHGCIPAHLWRANNRVIVCCLSFDTSEAYPYSAFLVLTRKLSTPALMNYAQRLLALKTSASAWITMTQRNVPSVMPSQSL